ncbi:MAG: hypothetical protein M9919_03650 [Burkholderiaceae bacterium]|nr:hypothetical protein [Burkholderiaceae bacterium]
MDDALNRLAGWLLRAVVFLAGLVVFLSLLTAVLVLAVLWGLRALWARLTGRPVSPWVMGVDPKSAWRAAASRSAWRRPPRPEPEAPPTPPQTGAAGPLMRPLPGTEEVTDVQPREPKSD